MPIESFDIQLDASLRCTSADEKAPRELGMCPSALVGKYFPDLLAPAEAPVIVDVLHGVLENCIGAVITASFDSPDGMRWMRLDAVPTEATYTSLAMAAELTTLVGERAVAKPAAGPREIGR